MTGAEQRTILITGCSSGIGLCVAEGLRERGYRVFATARKPDDVAALRARGLESLPLDLDDSVSIHAAVDDVLTRTGGTLHALLNNGAYGQPGAVEDLTRAALRAQFETNVFGTLELTSRCIPVMRAQGSGRIINVSSLLGLVALPYRGAYTATKFALEGFSDTLRLELAGTGIHVVLIEPGPIESRFRANAHAAYRNAIDIQRSAHREHYQAIERRLTRPDPSVPFTLAPAVMLKKVIHALESPHPKVRYYVTVPTYLVATLKRLLPYRLLDLVLMQIARRENR